MSTSAPSRTPLATRLGAFLLGAFLLAAGTDLVCLLAGADLGHRVAKPLLMPLLAGYAATRGAPRLLLAALAFGWGGDVFLLVDTDATFLLGMGSFAVGHVCYLVLFARRTTSPLLGLGYAVALVGAVTQLWPDLPAGLRVPLTGYALLLTAVAYRSSSLGAVAGTGGALFLLSDTLIATGIAEWSQPPGADFWVMTTYIAAQYLLTVGVLAARRGARRPAPGEP